MSKVLYFLAFLPVFLHAQNDSTLLLAPERLTERDILPRDLSQKSIRAISATRSLEAVDDSPFTTVVFTAEDILRNGFVTLTDVLKAAPGIRVSQPGNAIEGETFIVRGLSGNQYMKILINDIPIKPMMAPGMPIGAQLPIRQAERIEILYGPAGAIYGDETCAGVINIILKESERPVYTQADLGFGRYGYNSLDLMFGGKIGKDKKIFRFSLYGSSTVRDRTDVYYDQNLYYTKQYLPFGLDTMTYLNKPNFRSSFLNGDENYPRLSQLPHESRLFGINLTWRGLHFTYHRMLRFDHSSLGLSPLAVSYANPSNRIAERIETFSLGLKRQKKRRTSYNSVSFQRYKVDKNSTTTYVFDRLSAANFVAYGGLSLPDSFKFLFTNPIYDKYAADERFATALGVDSRIESRMNLLLGKRKRLQFDAGGQINLSLGVPLFTNYTLPVDVSIIGVDAPFLSQPIDISNTGQPEVNFFGFTQLAWHGKKLHIVGGGSASLRIEEGGTLAPRLGILYHLDSTWTIRGNFATGIRHGSPYAEANTFRASQEIPFYLIPGYGSPSTEITYSSEVGIKYQTPFGSSMEGVLFWQSAHDLLRPGYLLVDTAKYVSSSYGFENAPGLALSMWGFQGMLRTKSAVVDLTINKKKFTLTNRLEFFAQYTQGKERFGFDIPSINEIRNQPKWHTQFRFYFKAGKKFELVIASDQQSSTLSKSIIFRDQYQLPERSRLENFTTWDFMSRLYLSNHFLVYFQLINVFDRHYAGIDATGTPDDLLYNPQQGRQWRIGVNYNMN